MSAYHDQCTYSSGGQHEKKELWQKEGRVQGGAGHGKGVSREYKVGQDHSKGFKGVKNGAEPWQRLQGVQGGARAWRRGVSREYKVEQDHGKGGRGLREYKVGQDHGKGGFKGVQGGAGPGSKGFQKNVKGISGKKICHTPTNTSGDYDVIAVLPSNGHYGRTQTCMDKT
jgi:hypothetical protein